MTKLIVFDKDGTLMELGHPVVKLADDLINEFSARTDIHVPKSEIKDAFGIVDDHIDKMIGAKTTKAIVSSLEKLPNGDAMASWLLKKIEHATSDNEAEDIEIIKGVQDTLKSLHDKGYLLAIVSADDTASMDLFIDKYSIREYFDKIITSDSSDYHKPQKELLQLIMDDLNVVKEETVMVGDTEMDVELGQNGEVSKIVGVLSGSGDAQDLRNADIVLNSVAEMIDRLGL
ncbi:HAD family hydrolase [Macrococcoides canis]|uniref:HAD family hydrolase n=1 Tax=Macrococcoides canis TaxID=1855823 RepID=UPI001F25E7D9|nr:HAD family hydrolase [Macrococcus canis]UJS27662.1 HAD family hydrolase [Macrococcus canis]UTG99990.1 HAD family hydrolase [Macrococcus canis]WBF53020.1 HAD family hydrolase [Macrococcus canis]